MTQPPGLQPSQAPRRRRSWPRGHKRLTAGIAAFGLLLAIGAIASATESGETAAKVADPATRSTTRQRKGEHEGHRKGGHGGHRQSERDHDRQSGRRGHRQSGRGGHRQGKREGGHGAQREQQAAGHAGNLAGLLRPSAGVA